MAELKVGLANRRKNLTEPAPQETAPVGTNDADMIQATAPESVSPKKPTVVGVKAVNPALAAYVRPERGGHVINMKLPTELKVRVDKMYTELRVPRNKICLVALEEFLKTNGY